MSLSGAASTQVFQLGSDAIQFGSNPLTGIGNERKGRAASSRALFQWPRDMANSDQS
jgi:hypothetical protein